MYHALTLMIAAFVLVGCTSDPQAPVNQAFPIRQMDGFFNSMSGSPAAAPERADQDYTHEPGYAPAYPPFSETPAQ